MGDLIVTLDGPAGAGKSTVARMLAERLGVEFLDTGAMYRAVALLCVEAGVVPKAQQEAVAALAQGCRIGFVWERRPPALWIEQPGRERRIVGDRLRDPDVTALVSDVSAIPQVRRALVASQQQIGKEHPRLVTEGRDQGSVVFPQARVKFFLEASARVRAQRRAEQDRAAGRPADEAAIQRSLEARDLQDSTRSEGPLVCPAGALRIDTSELDIDQVVDALDRGVRQALAMDQLAASAAEAAEGR